MCFTLLHISGSLREEIWGKNIIPQPVDLHVSKIVHLSLAEINSMLDETTNKSIKLTQREFHCLEEMTRILKPFYEVTQKTQGEKVGHL